MFIAVQNFGSDGLDFEGGHFVATFSANSTSATVDIPIIADQDSSEGTEYFTIQLSVQSSPSALPRKRNIRLGTTTQAEVYILDEIILNFSDRMIKVEEGTNLTLAVTANAEGNLDLNFTINATGMEAQCK